MLFNELTEKSVRQSDSVIYKYNNTNKIFFS